MPGIKQSMRQVSQTVWNLKPLFKSDNDPRMDKRREIVERTSYNFINTWKDRTDYLEDPVILRKALDHYEAWKRFCGSDGDEGYYFWLRSQQDQNDAKVKAKFNKIEEFSKKIENDSRFFSLRIAKIKSENQQQFLNHVALMPYRHFLERIFAEARYHLSEPEEKILNLKSTTSYSNWIKMTAGFLSKESRTVIMEDGSRKLATFTELLGLMNNKKRKVRATAAKAFNEILKNHADSAEAEINSVLANKKVDDELRGVLRPDTLRHLADDIESGVVDTLIDSVAERFAISKRFYELKAKLFNVKRLEYHERNMEFDVVTKHYSFARSVTLVHTVLGKLDAQGEKIPEHSVSITS